MSPRKSDRLPFSGAPGHRRVRHPCTLTLPPPGHHDRSASTVHTFILFLAGTLPITCFISIVLFVVVLLVLRPTSATREASSNLDSATSLIPMPSRHPQPRYVIPVFASFSALALPYACPFALLAP
ncbi:uncharacterized protein J3D65DRAFT_202896 [Phyllosticta citribraziliensis]|uniref:Uncharacterized protein n=1 Tax=Phyllosticta citribraziliensis TaxID=989973 RepID=A0ABR1M3J5_9PEZI